MTYEEYESSTDWLRLTRGQYEEFYSSNRGDVAYASIPKEERVTRKTGPHSYYTSSYAYYTKRDIFEESGKEWVNPLTGEKEELPSPTTAEEDTTTIARETVDEDYTPPTSNFGDLDYKGDITQYGTRPGAEEEEGRAETDWLVGQAVPGGTTTAGGTAPGGTTTVGGEDTTAVSEDEEAVRELGEGYTIDDNLTEIDMEKLVEQEESTSLTGDMVSSVNLDLLTAQAPRGRQAPQRQQQPAAPGSLKSLGQPAQREKEQLFPPPRRSRIYGTGQVLQGKGGLL